MKYFVKSIEISELRVIMTLDVISGMFVKKIMKVFRDTLRKTDSVSPGVTRKVNSISADEINRMMLWRGKRP